MVKLAIPMWRSPDSSLVVVGDSGGGGRTRGPSSGRRRHSSASPWRWCWSRRSRPAVGRRGGAEEVFVDGLLHDLRTFGGDHALALHAASASRRRPVVRASRWPRVLPRNMAASFAICSPASPWSPPAGIAAARRRLRPAAAPRPRRAPASERREVLPEGVFCQTQFIAALVGRAATASSSQRRQRRQRRRHRQQPGLLTSAREPRIAPALSLLPSRSRPEAVLPSRPTRKVLPPVAGAASGDGTGGSSAPPPPLRRRRHRGRRARNAAPPSSRRRCSSTAASAAERRQPPPQRRRRRAAAAAPPPRPPPPPPPPPPRRRRRAACLSEHAPRGTSPRPAAGARRPPRLAARAGESRRARCRVSITSVPPCRRGAASLASLPAARRRAPTSSADAPRSPRGQRGGGSSSGGGGGGAWAAAARPPEAGRPHVDGPAPRPAGRAAVAAGVADGVGARRRRAGAATPRRRRRRRARRAVSPRAVAAQGGHLSPSTLRPHVSRLEAVQSAPARPAARSRRRRSRRRRSRRPPGGGRLASRRAFASCPSGAARASSSRAGRPTCMRVI